MIELIAALIWIASVGFLYGASYLVDSESHKLLEGGAIIVGTFITIAIPISSLGLLSKGIYAPATFTLLGVTALIAMSFRKKER